MYDIHITIRRVDHETGMVHDHRDVLIERRNLAQGQMIVKLLYDLASTLKRTVYVRGRTP